MINKVYLFNKKSSYSILKKNDLLEKIKSNRESFYPDILNAHKEHEKAKDKLQSILKKTQIPFSILQNMPKSDLFEKDSLIITLGGDGTFIHASHYVQKTPILGINSAPQSSTGHYCSISVDQKEDIILSKLEHIFNSKIPDKLNRLITRKNEKNTGFPFINDALFSNDNPADTSRYLIELDSQKEKHKSSGIWISTSSGSTAAFASTGGKPFSEIHSKSGKKQYGFIVRELYQSNKHSIRSGILLENQIFKLSSQMFHGKIYLDGRRNCIPIDFGDQIEFRFYDYPLLKF